MLRKFVALALIGVLGLLLAMSPSGAGQQHVVTYTLFNGVQTADSTPQASYWIPIHNANRIVIKLFTQAVSTDTATTDSITSWTTQFGDSMQFEAKDSLGTIVTSRSTIFEDFPRSNRFPMILDSTSVSGDGADTTKWVAIYHAPASTNALSWVATKVGISSCTRYRPLRQPT